MTVRARKTHQGHQSPRRIRGGRRGPARPDGPGGPRSRREPRPGRRRPEPPGCRRPGPARGAPRRGQDHQPVSNVDGQCRLDGRLTVLCESVKREDYWRAFDELTSQGEARHDAECRRGRAPRDRGVHRRQTRASSATGDPPVGTTPPPSALALGPIGAGRPGRRGAGARAGARRASRARDGRRVRGDGPCDTADRGDDATGNEGAAAPGVLEIHPLADLIPAMSDEQFARLKASIAKNGLREPIVVHEGKVVDGRHRYRACQELGQTPTIQDWDGRGSLVAYVADRNLERRHLTESQRALVGARLQDEFAREAKENMRRGGQGLADLPTLHVRERAAEVVGVSPRLVGSAARVVQAGTPELVAAVQSGAVAVSAAAEVVALAPEAQAALVARGPEAVRAGAKRLRKTKTGKAARRPGDVAGRHQTTDAAPTAGDRDDRPLTPPGWLEGFALRSRLARSGRVRRPGVALVGRAGPARPVPAGGARGRPGRDHAGLAVRPRPDGRGACGRVLPGPGRAACSARGAVARRMTPAGPAAARGSRPCGSTRRSPGAARPPRRRCPRRVRPRRGSPGAKTGPGAGHRRPRRGVPARDRSEHRLRPGRGSTGPRPATRRDPGLVDRGTRADG